MRAAVWLSAWVMAACGSASGGGTGGGDILPADVQDIASEDATADAADAQDGAAADVVELDDATGCPVALPSCVTACGSDAFLAPMCIASKWWCPTGSVERESCPPDTCWGAPPPGTECKLGKFVCKEGWVETGPGPQCLEATCENLSAALSGAILLALKHAQSCKADGDCIVAPRDTACSGSCGVPIRKDAAKAFAATLANLDDKLCKQTGYAEKCGYATPGCIAPSPGCVDSVCVYSKDPP